MPSKKPLIISGIGPGPTGVGRYMEALMQHLSATHDFNFINVNHSIRGLLKSKCYIEVFCEVWRRITTRLLFLLRVLMTRNRRIFLIHPQSIGLYWYKLLMSRNTVTHVLVDNFWFCKKSYNVRNNRNCLLCLNSIAPESSHCVPVSYNMLQKSYNEFYRSIRKDDCNFLVQTTGQKKLLVDSNLASSEQIKVIGLKLEEIDFNLPRDLTHLQSISKLTSIFFHGSLIEAKGFDWLLGLSKLMPEVTFFVPTSNPFNNFSSSNIKYVHASWGPDFSDLMRTCDIVLCPSIWSYVIEGALIKSLWFHGRVGIIEIPDSFSSDLPDSLVLKLSTEQYIAAQQLRDLSFIHIDQDEVSDFVIGLDKFSSSELTHFG